MYNEISGFHFDCNMSLDNLSSITIHSSGPEKHHADIHAIPVAKINMIRN